MPDFSIKIVPASVGLGAAFQPDLPGYNAGDMLSAAPSSIITWANMTNDPHQIATDDGTFTSEEILPELSSKPDFVLPSDYVTVNYRCTLHEGETGSINIQPVVDMDPLAPILAAFAALGIAVLSAMPARAQATQTACLPEKQALVRIPELVSSNGKLRATVVAGTEQQRMPSRYPGSFEVAPGKTQPSQPGDPQTFRACFPEWVRVFRSPDTTTSWPAPTKGLLDPLPGPTLRARVGDVIELTFLNQIDPQKFGASIDLGDQQACDSSSAGYPGGAKDTFPNCFHGSTTANIHFHGTHTNPNTTGDNVFLEILSSKRLTGQPSAPPPPPFDAFFAQCEAELARGSHVEWPVSWDGLQSTIPDYTAMQKALLTRFDSQPNIGLKLWPVNQKHLDKGEWPQYFMGSYPYCFKLPKWPDTTPAPRGTGGAGQAEMQAHQGMDSMAVNQQGGTLKMGQSPGTHWYHAHKHGSTTIDLSNGFGGAFIIEGQYDDEINNFYKAFGDQWTRTQPVLVINQFGTSPNLKGGFGQDKGPDFSVNGRTNPVITMKPGEVQMWRIVNMSGRAGALFLGPPAGFKWRRLAVDGVQLHPKNYANSLNESFLLAAGNRVDLLVQAPAACTTKGGCLSSVQVNNTVDAGDLKSNPPNRGPFNINRFSVNVTGTAVQMPFPDTTPAPTFPDDLADVTDEEVRQGGTQTIDFGTVPQSFANGPPPHSPAAVHTINGKQFNGEVGVSVLLNKAQEWTVTNNTTNISHPFHIHINPFQLTQIFAPNSTIPGTTTPRYVVNTNPSTPLLPGQCLINPDDSKTWGPCAADPNISIPQPRIWWDVFPIPSGVSVTNTAGKTFTISGFFKMRSRFVDYPGWFVIHCHILAHEDRGMMTVVEITPLVSKYSHH